MSNEHPGAEGRYAGLALTADLLGSTSVGTLVAAQKNALLHPNRASKRYAKDHVRALNKGNIIDTHRLGAEKELAWLDVDAYLKTVGASFNSPTHWGRVLTEAEQRGYNIIPLAASYGVAGAFGSGISELSEAFAYGSASFVGVTTDMVLLAAAAGSTLREHIKEKGKTAPAYNAALEIADRFGTPADNPQVLVDRLHSLFRPTGDTTSAFALLDRSGMFEPASASIPIATGLKSTESVELPYQHVAHIDNAFQAFGKLLEDPATLDTIATSITRKDRLLSLQHVTRRLPWGHKHSA